MKTFVTTVRRKGTGLMSAEAKEDLEVAQGVEEEERDILDQDQHHTAEEEITMEGKVILEEVGLESIGRIQSQEISKRADALDVGRKATSREIALKIMAEGLDHEANQMDISTDLVQISKEEIIKARVLHLQEVKEAPELREEVEKVKAEIDII